MFEISGKSSETRMIDFGSDGKVLFQLPVLGDPGVPAGITFAFGLFWDKLQNRNKMTDKAVMSAWSYFIDVMSATYHDATIELGSLDEKQLKQVIEHWVQESSKIGGYDPKAR